MTRDRIVLILAFLAITGGVISFILAPKVREELAPELVDARVALELDSDGIARTGTFEVTVGESFTLHAVLKAVDKEGQAVYYTEAQALEVDGVVVPVGRLRPWDRLNRVKVQWFTVEATTPHFEVERRGGLETFRFDEFYHPDWTQSWSIPGAITPRFDDLLQQDYPNRPFGTQRYHVRIELYEGEKSLVPMARYRSWGAPEIMERGEAFPAIVATLPSPMNAVSRPFGLSMISLPEDAPEQWGLEANRLEESGFAFQKIPLLRRHLEAHGVKVPHYREISIESDSLVWGKQGVHEGDLVRVGRRIVVLLKDAGVLGEFDGADLCLDFKDGAIVRRLDKVFETGGAVDWAPLQSP